MSQHKTILNLCLFLFSLTLFLSLTGCATLAVEQFIHHPTTHVTDEFAPEKKEFSGVYSGIEMINNRSYAHIVIVPDCKEMQTLNLFLPTEKNFDTKAIVGTGGSQKEQIPNDDKYIGQSVRILSYQLSNDMKTEIDKGMIPMQSSLDWHGYPSTVKVLVQEADFFGKEGEKRILIYKIGPDTNDFLMRSLTVDKDGGGNWQCKNKENNFAGIMLKIFTVPLDMITLPVQLSLVVIALCIEH